MNLLTAVNQGLAEIGLPQQSALVSSSSTDAIQILAIAQSVGMTLLQEWDWQQLEKQYTFNILSQTISATTTSGSTTVILGSTPSPSLDTTYQVVGTGVGQDVYVVSQVGTTVVLSQPLTATGTTNLVFGKTKYPMPSDFDRQISRTAYDKSRRWAMLGPATPQEWEWLKSSYISTGPRIRYRYFGGFLQTWPIIATGDLLSIEYMGNGYAIDAGTGLNKSLFTADTDTFIWSDRLFIAAFKYFYMAQRGLDTDMSGLMFQRQLSIEKAKNKGADTLSMGGSYQPLLIGLNNVPDGNYGQ